MSKIIYWNRAKAQYDEELIFSEGFLRRIYSDSLFGKIGNFIFTKKFFSYLYGKYHDSKKSSEAIQNFIERFKINMNEFEDKNFESFNDFFTRQFKKNAREFVADPKILPAFAEGKYLAFASMDQTTPLPIKGSYLDVVSLLASAPEASQLIGGPGFIARLCLSDYHRYHYPDDGQTIQSLNIHGDLQSVSPIAMAKHPKLLFKNERRISILETKNFGRMAMIEVGALTVGKIIQSHLETKPFSRGNEKGFFKIGGSTVILIGEKGKWKPNEDLLKQTLLGYETYLKLGEEIATTL